MYCVHTTIILSYIHTTTLGWDHYSRKETGEERFGNNFVQSSWGRRRQNRGSLASTFLQTCEQKTFKIYNAIVFRYVQHNQ